MAELGNDFLIGGQGADTIVGGQGNDAYDVDKLGDVIVENAGEGSESCSSPSIATPWRPNVETGVITSSIWPHPYRQ